MLKCFSEDDMDFCNVEGKNLPVLKFEEEDENPDPEGLKMLQMQMSQLNVKGAPEYERGTLVNIARSLLTKNADTNVSEVQ